MKGFFMFRSVFAGILLLAASVVPMTAPALAQDVRSRCATAGDDDSLRPAPQALVPRARRLFGFSQETPGATIKKSTRFRCMGGKVWLCNFGANLVCDKANASRSSPGAEEFCKQNPGSDVVPMAATGHDTIYAWKCVGKHARISSQTQKLDRRGFIAGNWKQLGE
jgi:hypothetical protein